MKVVIIEDEQLTANRLQQLLKNYDNSIEVLMQLYSVKEAIEWFKTHKAPDLILQDIQLGDGKCFEIYDTVKIEAPIVFTTAYSEYALKSFELNSIDYLVKPYDEVDIKRVMDKFQSLSILFRPSDTNLLKSALQLKYKVKRLRFLVHVGDNFKSILISEIAYFYYEDGLTFALTFHGNRYPLDQSLNDIQQQVEDTMFFRINRNFIVNHNSIEKINTWFNSRLKLALIPPTQTEIIVSRERIKEFKLWLGA